MPEPLEVVFEHIRRIRTGPGATLVSPGTRHREIFESLCRSIGARGNLVPDTYLAALAIENGCEWITTDRDFKRFPGLRWRHPLGRKRLLPIAPPTIFRHVQPAPGRRSLYTGKNLGHVLAATVHSA